MSTKYQNNHPTANLFELLQVDSDLPDQKRNKTQAKKPAEESGPNVETPAEKGQRRKALEAQKAAAAAAEKQRRETEAQMAALIPQEGFQVQKGSQPKKQSDNKGKVLNREQFNEKSPESEKKTFVKGPITGRKFDERKPGEKQPYRGDRDRQPKENTTRPPRHEGYDKHSGGKTSNKPPARKGGAGAGGWGDQPTLATETVDWDQTSAPAPAGGAGWPEDETPKVAVASSTDNTGWGDDKVTKSDKSDKKDSEEKDDSKKKSSEPAWDDEGHGKMTLEEFQKTVAAKRASDLEALKVGVKSTGRQIENTVDLSKCYYKDTTDDKEKKLAEDRKKEKADDAKRRGQQRAGTQAVDLSEYIDVRTRGGRGGRGGGRGGDRPPRGAEGQEQASPEPSRAARGGRGGRGGGGGGNRVPKKDAGRDAFPALAPAAPPKATK
jgi:hypothetical protein